MLLITLSFTLFVRISLISGSLPSVIRIGAIFTEDQKDSNLELAFKYAVYRINKDETFLPNSTLVYDIEYVPKDDSFRTCKKVCKLMQNGIQAIFGPPSNYFLGSHVQSVCNAMDMPHLEIRPNIDPFNSKYNKNLENFNRKSQGSTFSINLYPSQELLNKAFYDFVTFLNWTKVAIIYEDDFGLFRLEEFVRLIQPSKIELYIRQTSSQNYREVLREVRQKEIFTMIVDTDPKHILQLQMNDYRYHFMFTTFDLETFDLEDFKYNSVNITSFRLVDVEHPRVRNLLWEMERFQPFGSAILNQNGIIQIEPALLFDSVYVFANAISSMDSAYVIKPQNLSCDNEQPWYDGLTFYNYMDSVNFHGITGNLEFTEGKRANLKLDLLKLKKDDIEKVGYWNPNVGINVTDTSAFYETEIPNVTLIVMTREERPYVMLRAEGNLTGNDRFEGFCIDLLKWIASRVGFHYTIQLVPDNTYGVYDPDTKKWNGIVRELMDNRADLAVASITINYARESVIDFTKPFMNLGIGILFKMPKSQPTRLFSFMNPLAFEIWIYVLAAYILVSFTLFVMARFSPYEWNVPKSVIQQQIQQKQLRHQRHRPLPPPPPQFNFQSSSNSAISSSLNLSTSDGDIIENQFSISNSFWFITGTFLRQGSGLNPKVSERMPSRLFSFMNPLATEIWLYMIGAYFMVSLTIWIVARFSPSEWHKPKTLQEYLSEKSASIQSSSNPCCYCCSSCDDSKIADTAAADHQLDIVVNNCTCQLCAPSPKQPPQLFDPILPWFENDFTIGNSFWFTIGTLMQQESDLNPKATSTRIVGGIWWFFTLIIISSYTANLAAFLTVERMISPIENAADLADQTDISYGTLSGGSTMTFFRDSKIATYQKMWRYMESKQPSAFVPTYEEGIKRVLEGNYAFLMESTMLDYAVQRDCNLTQIGGLLDSKGYGIATPKGSPWRDKISLAILELQEKGIIQILYDKWWKNTGTVCRRDDKNKESKANALGVENIGGVFVVLLCGLLLAIIVAILEFCLSSRKNVETESQSVCSEMLKELQFAVKCHGSKQRPALKRVCTNCNPDSTYVPATFELPIMNGV